MKELSVTVRLRNNRLLERRKRLGLTQKDLAYAANVSFTAYMELELLKRSPLNEEGEWTEYANGLASFYEIPCEELFPDSVLRVVSPVQTRLLDTHELPELGSGRVYGELPPSPEEALEQKELVEGIEDALLLLNPREQEVIRRRFGFDDEAETLRDIGETLPRLPRNLEARKRKLKKPFREKRKKKNKVPLHAEAVRAVEARALRRLRHPSIAKHILKAGGGRR